MSPLTLTLSGTTEAVVTRDFAAPPALLWRAHTEADLLRRWCTGPDGWTMTYCLCEARVGGQIRYDWSNGQAAFHLTGEFLEVEPTHRLLHVERMHLPDPTPDNRVETVFTAIPGGTRMVMTMSVPDEATRSAMLATGMTEGMELSYQRLERDVLATV